MSVSVHRSLPLSLASPQPCQPIGEFRYEKLLRSRVEITLMTVRALDDVTSTLIIVTETVMNGDKMLNVQLLLLIQDDLLKFDNPFRLGCCG